MARRRVVGLDLSLTSTGAVCVTGPAGGVESRLKSWKNPKTALKDGDDQDRIESILGELIPWVTHLGPELVVIERYAFSKATNQSRLGELGGIVRWELTAACLPWCSVVNNTVKAFAGKGNADKAWMLAAAREIWPECPNHDVADALHIARWGFVHADLVLGRLGGRLHAEHEQPGKPT